jgi:hypothetical protein
MNHDYDPTPACSRDGSPLQRLADDWAVQSQLDGERARDMDDGLGDDLGDGRESLVFEGERRPAPPPSSTTPHP